MSCLFWLDSIVLVIEHFIQLHHKFLVYSMLEVRHLDCLRVKNDSITTRYGDVEVLEEFDDLLVGRLYLLLKQNEN